MTAEVVSKIAELAAGDAIEIGYLIETMQAQNSADINAMITRAGAAGAAIAIRNGLISRLVILVSRAYAPSRNGDLHLGRAFELLRDPEVRAARFHGGDEPSLADALEQWRRCVGDHRHAALKNFRDKRTVHVGEALAPRPNYADVFGLGRATSDAAISLAKGVGVPPELRLDQSEDQRTSARLFWAPWAQ